MNVRYDWRQLATTSREYEEKAVVREVQRLHTLGRTPDDIATLTGMNPSDVHQLLFGIDPEVANENES